MFFLLIFDLGNACGLILNYIHMAQNYWNEEWRDIDFSRYDFKITSKYQISNYGRIKSFAAGKIKGKVLRNCFVRGYASLVFRDAERNSKTFYIHKLVAEHFLPNIDPERTFVIHLDYNKNNNFVSNLQWANKREKELHQIHGPNFYIPRGMITNSKLTESQVKLIKRKLRDPNRKTKLKILARQFGISLMQLHRIKNNYCRGN